jgi:anti-anti-sigma factor
MRKVAPDDATSESVRLRIVVDHDTHDNPAGCRIRVAGELDKSAAAQLYDAVQQCLERRPEHLCVDLSDTTFLDAAGIRALLRCRDAATHVQCRTSLANLRPLVRQVLRIVALERVFGLPETTPPSPRQPAPPFPRRGAGPTPPPAETIAEARVRIAEAQATLRRHATVAADTRRLLGLGAR